MRMLGCLKHTIDVGFDSAGGVNQLHPGRGRSKREAHVHSLGVPPRHDLGSLKYISCVQVGEPQLPSFSVGKLGQGILGEFLRCHLENPFLNDLQRNFFLFGQ